MIRGGDKGQSGLDMAGGQGSVPDLPHQSCPPHPIPSHPRWHRPGRAARVQWQQGWAKQKTNRNQPCCWQRGAGEAERQEGENSVSPSSMARGWLWLIAYKLPPVALIKYLTDV